jgi:hypothetical protein
MVNHALVNALRDQGIRTDWDRARFARSLAISERTLRRWLHEGVIPSSDRQQRVARRLHKKPQELWPSANGGKRKS